MKSANFILLFRIPNSAIRIHLDSPVTHAGVEVQVRAQLSRSPRGQLLVNVAVWILEVAEHHGLVAILVAGLDAGRDAAFVHAVHAQGTGLDRALAARRVRFLAGGFFVHERPRLVGAGHHAVAAADADMLVYQHDAVGALERGARGADVHARR